MDQYCWEQGCSLYRFEYRYVLDFEGDFDRCFEQSVQLETSLVGCKAGLCESGIFKQFYMHIKNENSTHYYHRDICNCNKSQVVYEWIHSKNSRAIPLKD